MQCVSRYSVFKVMESPYTGILKTETKGWFDLVRNAKQCSISITVV